MPHPGKGSNNKRLWRLGLISVGLIVLTGCARSLPEQKPLSVYERVKQRGSIRCAYAIYNPGCMKDPNTGTLKGIGVDALQLLAKQNGLKVEWVEEVGWGAMIEGLQTDRYDIMATPIWPSSDREKLADFSKALYFSPVYAYVKSGNKNLIGSDLSVLNSPKYAMASIDGATAEVIAQKDFPKIRRVTLPQLSDFSQLLLTVATGKADVTFTEPADAAVFMKHNPNAIEKIGSPVRVFPDCWMFRKNQTEFKKLLDDGIDKLAETGALKRIVNLYEPEPNILMQSDSGSESQSAHR